MKRAILALGILLLTAGVGPAAAELTADDAFATLKGMAGSWHGTPEGVGVEAEAEAEMAGEVVHKIEVSAAGTVVMETMGPGTDHEMINMYHLDGDDLVLTHYCAGGNQPTMRLDREASTAERMIFDFTGGTNLDPATDHFIHDMELGILGESKIESVWNSWGNGEKAATMIFHLARGE
jgi:hypothetical protein